MATAVMEEGRWRLATCDNKFGTKYGDGATNQHELLAAAQLFNYDMEKGR